MFLSYARHRQRVVNRQQRPTFDGKHLVTVPFKRAKFVPKAQTDLICTALATRAGATRSSSPGSSCAGARHVSSRGRRDLIEPDLLMPAVRSLSA